METSNAAMREALELIVRLADDGMIQPRSKGEDDEHCFVAALDIARAALSAPARNCDILSEKAANEAWDDYRHTYVLPRGGWDFRHIIAWLYAKVVRDVAQDQLSKLSPTKEKEDHNEADRRNQP